MSVMEQVIPQSRKAENPHNQRVRQISQARHHNQYSDTIFMADLPSKQAFKAERSKCAQVSHPTVNEGRAFVQSVHECAISPEQATTSSMQYSDTMEEDRAFVTDLPSKRIFKAERTTSGPG